MTEESKSISTDARAIIAALDSDWIGRGFNFGIGLTAWHLVLGAIGFVLWTMLR